MKDHSLKLQGCHILMGVTGSIAAYKACEMIRMLTKQGAEVQVVMTESAREFVAPLTFETLTRREVIQCLFPSNKVIKTRHVSMAEWADCVLICPATANIIGKIASGIADDFLSTVVMASRAPVLFAPAMDYEMVQNPIYLDNCKKLKSCGYHFVDTETGDLASGAIGPGRLADLEIIFSSVRDVLISEKPLKDMSVLVTAGPTRESIDPVRYLSNRSSGKMGFALAEEASLLGANVTLISGPSALSCPSNIKRIHVETANEMARAVYAEFPGSKVVIMAAAVADYTVSDPSAQKLKKTDDDLTLSLKRTEDILLSLGKQKTDQFLTGFALESENGETNALQKLQDKNLDLICLNSAVESDAGFESDTNRMTLYSKGGIRTELELMPKWQTAQQILNTIIKNMNAQV